jgi:hypothetical protein
MRLRVRSPVFSQRIALLCEERVLGTICSLLREDSKNGISGAESQNRDRNVDLAELEHSRGSYSN